MIRELDPVTCPLDGRLLVEASAGTGKTFAIANLVVRLVVEEGLGIDQILVVTYTNAAAAELRDRVRARLAAAASALAGGEPADPVLASLVEAWPEADRAADRLDTALTSFDLAPISTIHGFCLRALRDHAFESGAGFATELAVDPGPVIAEVAQDLWTRRFHDASPDFLTWLGPRLSPATVSELVSRAVAADAPRVLPEVVDQSDQASARVAVSEAAARTVALWEHSGAKVILGALTFGSVFDANKLRKDKVKAGVEVLERELTSGVRPGNKPLGAALELFDSEELLARVRRGKRREAQLRTQHPLFQALGALRQALLGLEGAFETARLAGMRWIVDEAGPALTALRGPAVRFFDDLLGDVAEALADPKRGPRLAAALRESFPAALIDEFQDTDPVQYEIFSTIYGPPSVRLLLIGDPKQAIYAFRGADLVTYLKARASVGERVLGLQTNWRTDEPLVEAVNHLFGAHTLPFALSGIPYERVSAANKVPRLRVNGEADEPLQLRFVPDAPRKRVLLRILADDVVDLLDRAEVAEGEGWRTLRPADICVLVSTGREAADVAGALGRRGLPVVRRARERVVDTEEAVHVLALLEAVLDPADLGRVRTALATPLFDLPADGLATFPDDEHAVEHWLGRLRDWRSTWERGGTMRLFLRVLREAGVAERLLGFRGGERAMTNTRHLIERLHHVEAELSLGPVGIVSWLRRVRGQGQTTEELETRLESDAFAVQVVTMHASKGLEYPVVLCPFAWRAGQDGGMVVFHDAAADNARTLDLGSEDLEAHAAVASREAREERLRLFYVALTRAKHRAVLYWGRFGGKRGDWWRGPLAHLLHPCPAGPFMNAEEIKELDDGALYSALQALARGPNIAVSIVSERAFRRWTAPHAPPALGPPRTARRQTSSDLRISSFTALSASAHGDRLGRDRDAVDAGELPPLEAREPVPLASFPRGAQAGTAVHAVLEHLDFRMPRDERVVERELTRHGFEAETWSPVLLSALEQICAAPLGPEALSLGVVPRSERLDELEFLLPASGLGEVLTPASLATVFRDHGEDWMAADYAPRVARLEFEPLAGALRGFVDLIFRHEGRWYLVDYKSNHLGDHHDDYDQPALRQAMIEGHYILQYHLYLVALHRYLQQRLPEYDYATHFGGVRYLFLRGMQPGASTGVFSDRPSLDRLVALDALFVGAA